MKHLLSGLAFTSAFLLPLAAQAQPASDSSRTRAYTIDSVEQFTAGKLADAYFGDFVLENEQMRAVIARPDKPAMGEVRGGSLIDVISKSHPVDYFAALNSAADPVSTASVVIYDSGAPDTGAATPAVTLRGYVGELSKPAPAEKIAVETRYTLPGAPDLIRIDTTYKNETSATAWIQPVDQIDWGEAQVFAEGAGFTPTTATVNFAIGTADDFALGYYTSGTRAMEGYHRGRSTVILASGKIADLAERIEIQKRIAGHNDQGLPPQYRGLGVTMTPGPDMVVLPGTETRYGLSGGMPVLQPLYVPRAVIKVVDGKTTVTAPMKSLDSPFVQPDAETATSKVRLEPGATFQFTRYLALAGQNWLPIVRHAYAEKHKQEGHLAGVVLEKDTNAPIADARVQISASPGSDIPAGPLLQVTTGPDGSFSADLPPGPYRLHQLALGRYPVESATSATATTTAASQLTVLHMFPTSKLRIAISEAETATSSPLPSKLSIVAKPPFAPVNYGFSPDVMNGERNTIYMPQGFAVVPLTPGRYKLTASRGIEYDIFEKDITIAPGQEITVSAPLSHVMKDLLPGMVSVDAGLVTTASASGYTTPESRAIQAACEGVSVIVSGDYGTATDLQAAINKVGLQKWVKAFQGRRELLHKDAMSADLFVYPLDEKTAPAFDAAIKKTAGLPPDIAMADLRKEFPNLIFELDRPIHPEAGYLNSFLFDETKKRFIDDNIPPPDFNAIQLVEGSKLGDEPKTYARYMALQIARLQADGVGKGAPLSPVGFSASRLPHGQEVGYPRAYLYLKERKTLDQVSAEDVRAAIAGQHFLITNGPVLLLDGLDLENRAFSVIPGEIIDSHTTEVVRIRARVLEAPWLTLQGINTREDGLRGITVFNILPTRNIERYPTNQTGSNIYARYLKDDSVLDGYAYSALDSLAPIVPDDLPDFGGRVLPFGWSGPIFVDRNGDGRVFVKPEQILMPKGRPKLPVQMPQ